MSVFPTFYWSDLSALQMQETNQGHRGWQSWLGADSAPKSRSTAEERAGMRFEKKKKIWNQQQPQKWLLKRRLLTSTPAPRAAMSRQALRDHRQILHSPVKLHCKVGARNANGDTNASHTCFESASVFSSILLQTQLSPPFPSQLKDIGISAFSFHRTHPANMKQHCVITHHTLSLCSGHITTENQEKQWCTAMQPVTTQGFKTKCTWTYTHTQILIQHPVLQSCAFVPPTLYQWVCAEPTLRPGPSPPFVLWGGKGREIQPNTASDVLQSLFLWLLAGKETHTKHPLPSSLARELGLTPAPEYAAKAGSQREAFILSTAISPFAATPDSQNHWCWQAPLEASISPPCSSRVSHRRLPRVMSIWVLGFPRMETTQLLWEAGVNASPPSQQKSLLACLHLPKSNGGSSGSPLM